MWPAGIEPADAPRFRRALYRLSYGHMGWARLESNQRPLVCKTSARPRLSYSPVKSVVELLRSGRGWSRTSDLFLIREVLCLLSFPPVELRDKDSNLDLHVQSVASSR